MVRLYLLGYKGYYVISNIPDSIITHIDDVIVGQDKNIEKDYSEEIIRVCRERELIYYIRNNEPGSKAEFAIAIGWRWLIRKVSKIIVLHDSLLPRLRGFNPLVTALINGDKIIGVTALLAVDDYDKGPIIMQKQIEVNYPITINKAIEEISYLYSEISIDIISLIESKKLTYRNQNDKNATYSLWRNLDDYFINWSWNAVKINRFIDSVGYPYLGAKTYLDNDVLTIYESKIVKDIVIENRQPGKVIFKNEDGLTIVCGQGLILIKNFYTAKNKALNYSRKFRLKFSNEKQHTLQ